MFKQLVDASSLKPEIVSGLDIMIVRELTGYYFGEPRGIKPIEMVNVKELIPSYTTSEIERVARVAFDLQKKEKTKLHHVKNLM
ncbi:MAG: hypothetical protein CM1200mP5_1830 [Candidatus Pelagibacterales bacterium]|nr:MAG: hypothetical protein CM1200mP5_1830 [Pelagibacterales bacterium]